MSEYVAPANPHPCAECPWRTVNQGKRTPGRFYGTGNLARLWIGLRRGQHMSCHPTDPRMSEFAGYEETINSPHTHECTGSLILIQREVWKFQEIVHQMDADGETQPAAYIRYRRAHIRGLLREGLAVMVGRMVFRNTPLSGTSLPEIDLNEHGIGYERLGPWRFASHRTHESFLTQMTGATPHDETPPPPAEHQPPAQSLG